jgi:hypothetical protein
MSNDSPNPESIVIPTTSNIVAESEKKVADARQALADYTHQKIQSMAQSVPPAPVIPQQQVPQVPQIPQQYQQAPAYPPVQVTAQFGQPQYPPQPQYPVAPQPPPPPRELTTVDVMVWVHTLLDGYEAKAAGIYPPELRAAMINEINKLKSYQEKLQNISNDTRDLLGTVLSQMVAPQNRGG